jgi:hypothetical protein
VVRGVVRLERPGIWFPFGVGVSRTQFALAFAIPLLAAFLHLRASPTRSE